MEYNNTSGSGAETAAPVAAAADAVTVETGTGRTRRSIGGEGPRRSKQWDNWEYLKNQAHLRGLHHTPP